MFQVFSKVSRTHAVIPALNSHCRLVVTWLIGCKRDLTILLSVQRWTNIPAKFVASVHQILLNFIMLLSVTSAWKSHNLEADLQAKTIHFFWFLKIRPIKALNEKCMLIIYIVVPFYPFLNPSGKTSWPIRGFVKPINLYYRNIFNILSGRYVCCLSFNLLYVGSSIIL